eukprot:CAMPEP_0172656760 /NCGR_PEP_ID=MMETSP1074-20121228/1592_1 /TAXON_ID=2916 /ORGANISM="Ceratium fusus, Strain PA161109" /LENGTH=190 /DNA_ID=CAMNT_0013471673 /DNA_START=78 /DNA_END=647 /DNA_ORIENTATION=+
MAGLQIKWLTLMLVLSVTSVILSGCSFGTSQDRHDCDGHACDCVNTYYGMEAGMYLAGVPIEHASLNLTIPRVEPDTANSTGCCLALYDMAPVHEGTKTPSAGMRQRFSKACAKSPNLEVAEAAASCSVSALSFLLQPATRKHSIFTSNQNDMDGSDAYSDCQVDIDASSILLVNGKNLTGVKSRFNIRW